MPTTRPRHTITETDEIATALDAAAKRWPEERPGQLLRRLIEQGSHALEAGDAAGVSARREAVERTAGVLSGSYPDDYLKRLREEWPG